MMPKRDHERDVELDKKIEALRRKNEVLMKRYKVRTSACRWRSACGVQNRSSSDVEVREQIRMINFPLIVVSVL